MGGPKAPVIKTAQQGSRLGGLNSHQSTRRENCDGSTALADAPGLQRDNFTPRRRPNQIFWHFFCNAEHQLAAAHFGPDILWTYTGVNPKHHEIVKQVGAFPYHRLGLTVHRIDDDLDRLFGELLRHFGAA